VGVAAIPLVLAARAIAVILPLAAMRPFLYLGPMAPPILIWGGLRGGISIALALGLPDGLSRSIELTATYIVVMFAVIAQGGTIARLIEWWRVRFNVNTDRSDKPEAPTT
jgi:monovalent cation:H+ antiporter, CPA1 family